MMVPPPDDAVPVPKIHIHLQDEIGLGQRVKAVNTNHQGEITSLWRKLNGDLEVFVEWSGVWKRNDGVKRWRGLRNLFLSSEMLYDYSTKQWLVKLDSDPAVGQSA